MEKARIGIFEDNPDYQDLFGEIAEENGHTIVVRARTMDQAEATIGQLLEGDIDIAIVDGNMSDTTSGDDGAKLTEMIHTKFENVVVIGSSGGDDVRGADHNLPKADVVNLGSLIAKI